MKRDKFGRQNASDVEFFWFKTDRAYRVRLTEPSDGQTYAIVHRDIGIVEVFTSDDPKVTWLNDDECERLVRKIIDEHRTRIL